MKANSSLSTQTMIKSIILVAGLLVAITLGVSVLLKSGGNLQMTPASTMQQAMSSSTLPSQQGGSTLVYQHDFGTWRYSAYRATNGGNLLIEVSYDRGSINGIKAFAAENKKLATQLAATQSPIETMITFRAPMPIDQFRGWAKAENLLVEETQLREAAGRVTISLKGTQDEALPQQELDSLDHGQILGVINVHCTVAASKLSKLIVDPALFLVDVTPTWVRLSLIRANIPGAEQAKLPGMVSPFYDMETLGLNNFALTPGATTTIPMPSPVRSVLPTMPPPVFTNVPSSSPTP